MTIKIEPCNMRSHEQNRTNSNLLRTSFSLLMNPQWKITKPTRDSPTKVQFASRIVKDLRAAVWHLTFFGVRTLVKLKMQICLSTERFPLQTGCTCDLPQFHRRVCEIPMRIWIMSICEAGRPFCRWSHRMQTPLPAQLFEEFFRHW